MKTKLRANFFSVLFMSILLILSVSFFVTGQDAPADIPSMDDVLTTTGIQAWIDTGWTGEGEHIAILDTGFGGVNDYLAGSSLTIQLPDGASLDDYHAESIISGTLALEAISSIAPDADYSLCRYQTFEEYNACVEWLIESEVDIINHSTGVPAITIDGNNVWEAQGQGAAEAGILWVNAVGDYNGGLAPQIYFTIDEDGYSTLIADGAPSNFMTITPAIAGQQTIAIAWEDTSLDLDLLVETSDGTLYRSEQSQLDGGLPIEFLTITTDEPYILRVVGITPPTIPSNFVIYTPFTTADSSGASLISPASFRNVLAVGAVENNAIAPYSSQGPGSDGGIKPDLASSGAFILPSGKEFRGTGAATGLVSATAALVSQAYPDYSLQEIFEFIANLSTQDDSINIGPDNSFGNGYLYIREPENEPDVEPIIPFAVPPQNVDTGFEPPYVEVEEPVSNVREGPGVNYPSAGQVHQGDSFAVNAQADQNNWYQIQVNNPDNAAPDILWIPASNVGLHNADPDDIPPADSLSIPDAPAPPTNVPTPFPPNFTPPPVTLTPTATPGVDETPTATLDSGGGTSTLLYGAFWTYGGVNLRLDSNGNATFDRRLACGEIIELVIRKVNDVGETWYQTIEGNWVAGFVIETYPSQAEADANYNTLHTNCDPPTETPTPTVEAPTDLPPGPGSRSQSSS